MNEVRIFMTYNKIISKFERVIKLRRIPQKGDFIVFDGELYTVYFLLTIYDNKSKQEQNDIYLEKCQDKNILNLISKENRILPTHLVNIEVFDMDKRSK